MLPGGVRQYKVIETVREPNAGDVTPRSAISEVRQALLTRRMVLTEDHFALGAVLGAPGADATLQRAAPLHLVVHHHRPHAGTGDQ